MFDNFGMGEFFALALLALILFGPERLPQMGARLGRWIAKLTTYSRTFMTEWREEALAIQEAVTEVRNIRDEIIAAQQEISGSLQTARQDVEGGIELAKEAITDARQEITQNIQNQREMTARELEAMAREQAARREKETSESEAIEKTQQILAGLRQKHEGSAAALAGGPDTMEERPEAAAPAEPGSTEAAPGTTPAAPATEEDEWERNRRAIAEIMSRSKSKPLPASLYHGPARTGTAAPEAASAPATGSTPQVGKEAAPEPPAKEVAAASEPAVEPKQPRASAFDRTQKILDNLSRRRSGEIPEEDHATEVVEPATEPQAAAPAQETAPAKEKRETAFERSQQILDNLKRRKSTAVPTTEPAVERVPGPAVDREMLEQLQTQVAALNDQIAALRREMEAIRAASHAVAGERAVEEAVS